MRFHFTDDQRALQDGVRDFLQAECTPQHLRALWETKTGRSPEFWEQLAQLGVLGLLVPEAQGGMGLDEIDFVLLLEEMGRVALPEPVISTAAVAVPLLRELGDKKLCDAWLAKIASGEAIVAVGHDVNAFTSDAHVANLLLLQKGSEIHALTPSDVRLTEQKANDPAQRLFSIDWTPSEKTRIAQGEQAEKLLAAALDRGALACAAQLLGVCQQLIQRGVNYALQRQQFDKPIGSFQAIKHMLAELQVHLEYARPVVYRAAHSVARGAASRSLDVSAAKLAAADAAKEAAKVVLQVHGAIGYTWEEDTHIWMRRAWSLDLAWGRNEFHRERAATEILDVATPAASFGYSAPAAR